MAFCPSHVVPGIDFSNDPLLQGRLFSYLDKQLSRLGSANFHQIPVKFDAVAIILSNEAAALLGKEAAAIDFVRDAFGHLKAIGVDKAAKPC